jgi:hypothetical protein
MTWQSENPPTFTSHFDAASWWQRHTIFDPILKRIFGVFFNGFEENLL